MAAAEMGLLAGGTRVEGCLLGNGERTGNVDIITLALNMYSQGVSPNLDFSNLGDVVKVVERCNEMSTPPRYPYAGSLVYSAFAGTHQDAIKKGFDAQDKRWAIADAAGEEKKIWSMPYIPIDPADLGFGYDNLIRVSSQSGKAGAAYVVKRGLGVEVPRNMQVLVYNAVQKESEKTGKEMTMNMVVETFKRAFYFDDGNGNGSSSTHGRIRFKTGKIFHLQSEPSSPQSECSDETLDSSDDEAPHPVKFEGELLVDGQSYPVEGHGIGPFEALQDALNQHLHIDVSVVDYAIQKITSKSTGDASSGAKNLSQTATFVEINHHADESGTPAHDIPVPRWGEVTRWGVGISEEKTTSRFLALISAVNSIVGDREFRRPRSIFHRRPAAVRTSSNQDISHLTIRAGHNVERSEEWSPVRQLQARAASVTRTY